MIKCDVCNFFNNVFLSALRFFLLCLKNKLKCKETYAKRFIVSKKCPFDLKSRFFAPAKGVTIQITELCFSISVVFGGVNKTCHVLLDSSNFVF